MGEGTEQVGISRRDALKKAAAVGGAIWIVPTIQTVNMSRALATSPPSVCSRFRVSHDGCGHVNPKDSCLPSQTDPDRCDPINTYKSLKTPKSGDWVICLDRGCEVQGVSLFASSSGSHHDDDDDDDHHHGGGGYGGKDGKDVERKTSDTYGGKGGKGGGKDDHDDDDDEHHHHASATCWYSQQIPTDPSHGLPANDPKGIGSWSGWYVDSYNCLHIPRPRSKKTGKSIDIGHVDVIVCCR